MAITDDDNPPVRRVILRLSIALAFILVVCTIVSSAVYRLLLPEVWVGGALPSMNGRSILVPQTSVYYDNSSGTPQAYLFAVLEQDTIWGRRSTVGQVYVTYIGEDYQYIEVEAPNGMIGSGIALYPSQELYDGAVVAIHNSRSN